MLRKFRQQLESWPGFRYEDWQTAAQFCADNKINLDEALIWADKAISGPFRGASVGHEDFSTLQTKAAVLDAMGREADADVVMQKAFTLPDANAVQIYIYAMHVLRSGKKDKAMRIFVLNQQKHPDDLTRICGCRTLARNLTTTSELALGSTDIDGCGPESGESLPYL